MQFAIDSISAWGRIGMGVAAVALILPIFLAGMIFVESTGFAWRRLPRLKRQFWLGSLCMCLAMPTLGFTWIWPASGVNEVQMVMTASGPTYQSATWRGVSGWLLWHRGRIEAVNLKGIIAQLPVSLIVIGLTALMYRWGIDRFRLNDPGRCDNCGYDTRACSSAKCPECGLVIALRLGSDGGL